MKALGGDVDARVHIYTATALGRGRVASPTLGHLYPRGESLLLIFKEGEWTPGPVWTRRSEEKSPPLRHPGSNPVHPAGSQTPFRLCYLVHRSRLVANKKKALMQSVEYVLRYRPNGNENKIHCSVLTFLSSLTNGFHPSCNSSPASFLQFSKALTLHLFLLQLEFLRSISTEQHFRAVLLTKCEKQ